MSEPKTYFDPYGKETLPVPPLDDLRAYIGMNTVDLPPERFNAAETWWFTIDHPGLNGPICANEAPEVASLLREVGFTEPDIREALIRLLAEGAPELTDFPQNELEQRITDCFLRIIQEGEK